MSRPIGMATSTVEELEAEIERLRHEIDVQCSSEYVERILKENERLQATVEHLQDQCKEKHDSMIAMMNEALALRDALERIRKYASAYTANRDISYLAAIARKALGKLREEDR